MGTTNISMPQVGRQPPAVDFIDNRLPKHHRMFQNPPIHYEPSRDLYVSNASTTTAGSGNAASEVFITDDFELPPRPANTDLKAMRFWRWLFPDAMAALTSRSTSPTMKADYNIRQKPTWEAVYETLETARGEYQTEDGKRKLFRKVRRRAADHVAPAAEAARSISTMVPDFPFSTPVLGAVVVILDVRRRCFSG